MSSSFQVVFYDHSPEIRSQVESLLNHEPAYEVVYKDNRHSFVASIACDDRPVFVKVPRGRDRRAGERLMTLYHRGETVRYAESMQTLAKLGFVAPKPLAYGIRKRLGMVVESFLIYEGLDGRPAAEDDAHEVVRVINRLHAHGYVRRDAIRRNFLITDDGVGLIDFRLSKPVIFRKYKFGLEQDQVVSSFPGAAPLLENDCRNSFIFKAGVWGRRRRKDVSRIRRNKYFKFSLAILTIYFIAGKLAN